MNYQGEYLCKQLRFNFATQVKKVIPIVSFVLLLSCQDIANCDANDEQRLMVLEFLSLETKEPRKVGFLIGSGNVVYEGIYSLDSTLVNLPLDPNNPETSFFFLTDTSSFGLTVSYETQVSIFDDDCEPSFTFMNLDTISYSFDSLSIPGRITNRQIETNVQVFF